MQLPCPAEDLVRLALALSGAPRVSPIAAIGYRLAVMRLLDGSMCNYAHAILFEYSNVLFTARANHGHGIDRNARKRIRVFEFDRTRDNA